MAEHLHMRHLLLGLAMLLPDHGRDRICHHLEALMRLVHRLLQTDALLLVLCMHQLAGLPRRSMCAMVRVAAERVWRWDTCKPCPCQQRGQAWRLDLLSGRGGLLQEGDQVRLGGRLLRVLDLGSFCASHSQQLHQMTSWSSSVALTGADRATVV